MSTNEFENISEKARLAKLNEPVAFVKPKCKLVGTDGNVFSLIGLASKALRKAGLPEKAKEMSTKIFACGSYGEALSIMDEYVDIR